MDQNRLKLACEGKTASQGGLNVDELKKVTGLKDVSRDILIDAVCKMYQQKVQTKQKVQTTEQPLNYYSSIKSVSFRDGVQNTQYEQETEVKGSVGKTTTTKDGKTTTKQLSADQIQQLKHTSSCVHIPMLFI